MFGNYHCMVKAPVEGENGRNCVISWVSDHVANKQTPNLPYVLLMLQRTAQFLLTKSLAACQNHQLILPLPMGRSGMCKHHHSGHTTGAKSNTHKWMTNYWHQFFSHAYDSEQQSNCVLSMLLIVHVVFQTLYLSIKSPHKGVMLL